jgi:hypothetical protein
MPIAHLLPSEGLIRKNPLSFLMEIWSARISIPFLCESDPQESAFLSYANLIHKKPHSFLMRTWSARIRIPFLCEPDPQDSTFLSYANLIRRIRISLPYVYLIINNPQNSAFLSYAGLFYNNPHPFALPYAVVILRNRHSFLMRVWPARICISLPYACGSDPQQSALFSSADLKRHNTRASLYYLEHLSRFTESPNFPN